MQVVFEPGGTLEKDEEGELAGRAAGDLLLLSPLLLFDVLGCTFGLLSLWCKLSNAECKTHKWRLL